MPLKKYAMRSAVKLASPVMFKRYFSHRKKMVSWNGKLSAVTISFDSDFPEDIEATPKILEMLETFGIKSSFACIGKFIEKHHALHKDILRLGHEIINHTYTHPNGHWNPDQYFNKLNRSDMEKEIMRCQETCKKILKYTPTGFRTPHFGNLHTTQVYEILEKNGFLYSSSTTLTNTKSYGIPYFPSKKNFREPGTPHFNVLELPLMSCPEHYYPLLDTWHCYMSKPPAHNKEGDLYRLFRKALGYGLKYNSYINLYFDPKDVITEDFRRILNLLKSTKNVWVAKSEDVCRLWEHGKEK